MCDKQIFTMLSRKIKYFHSIQALILYVVTTSKWYVHAFDYEATAMPHGALSPPSFSSELSMTDVFFKGIELWHHFSPSSLTLSPSAPLPPSLVRYSLCHPHLSCLPLKPFSSPLLCFFPMISPSVRCISKSAACSLASAAVICT